MAQTIKLRGAAGETARGGFTLVEALIAAAVLAIVSASAVLPFLAGVQQVGEAAELEEAVALGQAMMEEVLARPFFHPEEREAAPGAEAGETQRDQFTIIDDFHGFTESVGQLSSFEGTLIEEKSAAGFRRTVTVQYVRFPGLAQETDDVKSFVHIKVRVYRNNTAMVTLDRIVARED